MVCFKINHRLSILGIGLRCMAKSSFQPASLAAQESSIRLYHPRSKLRSHIQDRTDWPYLFIICQILNSMYTLNKFQVIIFTLYIIVYYTIASIYFYENVHWLWPAKACPPAYSHFCKKKFHIWPPPIRLWGCKGMN